MQDDSCEVSLEWSGYVVTQRTPKEGGERGISAETSDATEWKIQLRVCVAGRRYLRRVGISAEAPAPRE